jgi:transposase
MEEIWKMFKIDRKTIYWWRKRREETGSIKPSSGCQKGDSYKIKDLDSFVIFLDENMDIKVEKIIEKFGNMC